MKVINTAKILLLTLLITLGICYVGGCTKPPLRQPKSEDIAVYKDTDHEFNYTKETWAGPEGYVIVVPKEDPNAYSSALLLQEYYNTLEIQPQIVTDEAEISEKEILIGNTNRTNNIKLTEAELKVYLDGQKLVFSGGHSVTVDSAVKKFIRLAPGKNEVYTFSIKTDFESQLQGELSGYKYIWGDEFEGSELDPKNWNLAVNMSGSKSVELSKAENVVCVSDGRLKLHALSYFNNNRPTTEYRVPYSVVTQKKMNYVYGYMEVRSRIPYKPGCWPSFWTRSTDYLSGSRNYDYMVEVDIYEIFKTNRAYSTLHKWYTAKFDYNGRYNPLKKSGKAVSTNTANGYVATNPNHYIFKQTPTLTYEYHTYGYEWTPTEIKMSVDRKVFCTFDITKSFDKNPDQSGFHDPQYIIFNNHIFHPEISTACVSIKTVPQSLPAAHYVDYIRLYQKDGVGKVYTEKVQEE